VVTPQQELLKLIDELEASLSEGARLLDLNSTGHKIKIVQLRRSIADCHTKIYTIGSSVFSTSGHVADFDARVSKLRGAIARHRSCWPVVMIDLEKPDYRLSLETMREANHHFIAWIRSAAQTA
jgi:hypothetical protein